MIFWGYSAQDLTLKRHNKKALLHSRLVTRKIFVIHVWHLYYKKIYLAKMDMRSSSCGLVGLRQEDASLSSEFMISKKLGLTISRKLRSLS